jgi:hypothetical protein
MLARRLVQGTAELTRLVLRELIALRAVKDTLIVSTNNASCPPDYERRAAVRRTDLALFPGNSCMCDADLRRVVTPWFVAVVASASVALASTSGAQTYVNTGPGRPIQIEDASPLERFALEGRLAPVSFGGTSGRTGVVVEPGLAYGLVPRLQVDLAAPVGFRAGVGGRSSGVAGIALSTLYAFNVETRSLPAVAARLGIVLPVGSFGPRRAHESLRAIATRTFPWGRFHFNHQYTFGDEPGLATTIASPTITASSDVGGALSRWTTGIAVDHAFPLRGVLVAAELFARHPLADSLSAQWHAGAGMRYQLTRAVSLDVGGSAAFSGDERPWSVRVGVSRATSLRRVMPGLGGSNDE